MIDASKAGELLTLAEVAMKYPGKGGKRYTAQAVYGWATRGVKGVVLETAIVGGRIYSTDEAIRQFSEALTAKWRTGKVDTSNCKTATGLPARSRVAAARADAEAARQLEAAGI